MEGRQTATRGFGRAAAYVAGRLRGMGIQPVLQGEYRWQYAAMIRRANRLDLRVIDPDTTRWLPGRDMLITDIPQRWRASGQGLSIPGADFLRWRDGAQASWSEEARWRFEVDVVEEVTTAPMHVMGYLAGADPLLRDSLVVLVAPLDGFGLQREQSWTDGRDLSLPAAVVLEATRRLTTMQRQWAFLPHSTMIVFISGTWDACQGGEALLRHLPWDKEAVLGIHVVRMAADERCDWPRLVSGQADLDIPVTLWPVYSPFDPEAGFGFGPWRPRSMVLRDEATTLAVDEALRVARGLMEAIR